jgi:hypothetical protein
MFVLAADAALILALKPYCIPVAELGLSLL